MRPATPEAPRTYLAFDFGERRIGVAVGQTLTGTATPLAVVPATARGPDWRRLGALVREWQPQGLVVGVPLHLDGTEQPMTDAARRFGRRLEGRFGVRVEWADERLTTRTARERLAAAGAGGEADDAVAAQVILEAWLAERAGEVP